VAGTLYGTTMSYLGNDSQCWGAVFKITSAGKESVLSCLPATEAHPAAGLINVDGKLYGTSRGGGNYRCGTVFSVTSSGKLKLLYAFSSASSGRDGDGCMPAASLIDVSGTLYGTTSLGGSGPCQSQYFNGCGTVFAISTSGKERVLHSFGESSGDGAEPKASLTDVAGLLYGTTSNGGAYDDGTVFKITTSGKEAVLHSFGKSGSKDGIAPAADLTDVNGMLYGTTSGGGGTYDCCGTVFSITTSGEEKMLYRFMGGRDGAIPEAGLVYVEKTRTLYGTTAYGGEGLYYNGYGTVFALGIPTGYKVLHNFKGCPHDGANPEADLTNVGNTLYGTTLSGGKYYCSGSGGGGLGTVFSLSL
jgi:uncharacterized repeat protein (TIGR03803 family)